MLEAIQWLLEAGHEFYLVWHPPVHEVSIYLYNAIFFPVLFFSSLFYILAFSGMFSNPRPPRPVKISQWPRVSVQIPTLNEIVALRCARKCLKFDYPKDRYEIIIGDDSDNMAVSMKIDEFSKKHQDLVKVTRRENREGFKAGNLNNMLMHSSGDIVVIFDSDFIPPRNFLRKAIPPFVRDKKLGYVQAKWRYINMEQNIVTRFASAVLMLYHNLLAAINSRARVPLLFGSGQAVRKELLLKLGKWQEGSLTEDVEFSLRALKAGYRSVYLSDLQVSGEVPFTKKGFFRQQKKWAYGNARAFLDHKRWILFGRGLNPLQRAVITFTTLGYIASPFLVLFMFLGVTSFMTGDPAAINWSRFLSTTGFTMLVNSGFVVATLAALSKERRVRMFFHILAGSLTVGLYTSFGVTLGFLQAITGRRMDWYMIRKAGNETEKSELRPSNLS